MFDIGWSELLLVLVVALVVVGPKDLPRLMRTIGRWVGKARNMADQFKKSFEEMAHETELSELRNEIEALRRARPLGDVEDELNNAIMPPATSPDFAEIVPEVEPQPVAPPDEHEQVAATESAAATEGETTHSDEAAAPAEPAETGEAHAHDTQEPPPRPTGDPPAP